MVDSIRIRSNLPLAVNAPEPIPDEFKDKPGLAPAQRAVIIRPGLNEFSGADSEVYTLWAKNNPQFIADDDAIKAGATDGLVYEVEGDEPDDEFGFEPALARASSGDNASAAAQGSTVKDSGPVKASDMAQTSTSVAPAVTAVATPISGAPVSKAAPAPAAAPGASSKVI